MARTLFTVLDETASALGAATALWQPEGGKLTKYTWAEYRDAVREIACGLYAMGFRKGDVLALASETRAEFYFSDLAVACAGCIAAAIYTSLPVAEQADAIRQSDAKAMLVENANTLRNLRNAGAPGVPAILLTGGADGEAITLAELRARGRDALKKDPAYFDLIHVSVQPEDHAILYMTSGATGAPKMGLVSHRAVVANIDLAPKVIGVGPHDITLAFLPSAHIAQRLAVQLIPIRCGMQVYFSEGLSKLPHEMRSVRPTFLLAPPRVWERIYSSIAAEIKKKPAAVRNLFYGALGLGLRASRLRAEGKPVPAWMSRLHAVADKLVFTKIRRRLGGRLRLAISGSAPLGKELAGFFQAVNVPLVEGYGLTEGGITTLNPLNRPKPGTIGVMLPGIEAKTADDGELLIKGDVLFSGYYKDPEATAVVLQDGWLHTGDIASIDPEGYISITGRKKELIVASNGKKIYPSRVEQLFKTEPLISQVILIGDRQPYVTALFTINASTAESLPGMEAYKGRPPAELASAPAVTEQVGRIVKDANRQLAPFEQIRRFRVLQREFTIDSGELTPTLKIRRKQVIENHRDLIAELYVGREEMS